MKENIIISEKMRPLWQRLIASLFFTAAISFLIYGLYKAHWTDDNAINIGHHIKACIYLVSFGIAFSFHQSVYINLKESKFRATIEIGPVKLGQWKTINKYEYVSIFHQPFADGEKIFEVNLWYDKNKHWQLYEKYDYKEAFIVGFEISDLLEISLLDATVPNDYKWIDKKASKNKGEMIFLD